MLPDQPPSPWNTLTVQFLNNFANFSGEKLPQNGLFRNLLHRQNLQITARHHIDKGSG